VSFTITVHWFCSSKKKKCTFSTTTTNHTIANQILKQTMITHISSIILGIEMLTMNATISLKIFNRCSVVIASSLQTKHFRNYISIKDLLSGDDETDNFAVGKATENYPISKQVNGRFVSPWSKQTEKKPFDVLKYLLTSKQQKLLMKDNSESHTMLKTVDLNKKLISSTLKPNFTWMGHATCYYQTDGVYFLTDPVFSNRASFSQYYGPKRFMPPPADVEELKIDVVLLSHTHYDHMDEASVKRIGNKALW
jgi:hypothetical protein